MKKILSILICTTLLHTPVWASTASEPNVQAASAPAPLSSIQLPEIKAVAYLVQDLQSGQILAQANADQKIEPASLTKVMTAYLVFQALENKKITPDQTTKTSEHAWRQAGSRMFLELGKPVSVQDLMHGLVVQLANDAAVSLAELLAGSEAEFVELMNAEAKRLGMTNTHFDNATGLSSQTHLTTVKDLAILSNALIRDFPQYYKIYSTKSFTYNTITQQNRNLLLFRDDNIDGLAAGYTNSGGYNLIASSKRDGRRVLSIVAGAASAESRATESSKLLNYALLNFDTQPMFQAGKEVSTVKIFKGAQNSVAIGFGQDAYVTVPRNQQANIKSFIDTNQPVLAPIKKGQVLGTFRLMHDEQVLAEQPVVALQDVGESGWFGRLVDSFVLWFQNLFAD